MTLKSSGEDPVPHIVPELDRADLCGFRASGLLELLVPDEPNKWAGTPLSQLPEGLLLPYESRGSRKT